MKREGKKCWKYKFMSKKILLVFCLASPFLAAYCCCKAQQRLENNKLFSSPSLSHSLSFSLFFCIVIIYIFANHFMHPLPWESNNLCLLRRSEWERRRERVWERGKEIFLDYTEMLKRKYIYCLGFVGYTLQSTFMKVILPYEEYEGSCKWVNL